MNSNRVYIETLNANDTFTLPGGHTRYVVERRHTTDNMTSVVARVEGESHLPRFEFVQYNRAVVDVVL